MPFEFGVKSFLAVLLISLVLFGSGLTKKAIYEGKTGNLMVVLSVIFVSIAFIIFFMGMRSKQEVDVNSIKNLAFQFDVKSLKGMEDSFEKENYEHATVELEEYEKHNHGIKQILRVRYLGMDIDICLFDNTEKATLFYRGTLNHLKGFFYSYGIQEEDEINGTKYFVTFKKRHREGPHQGFELSPSWYSNVVFQRNNIMVQVSESTDVWDENGEEMQDYKPNINGVLRLLTSEFARLAEA